MTVKDPQHDLIAPRKWLDLFLRMNGGYAVAAVIFLVLMTVLSVRDYKNATRLANHSEVATAMIVKKNTGRSNKKTKYYLSYRFDVDLAQYDFTRSTSRQNYDVKKIGDTIDLYYWPEDPKVLQLRRGETLRSAKNGQLVAFIAGVIALSIVWFFGMRTNRAILARKKGVLTKAKITRIIERRHKWRRTGKGYMEFRTDDGPIGRTVDHDISGLSTLGEGTEIAVFERKGEVWWEGDVGPRKSVPSQLPKVSLPPSE